MNKSIIIIGAGMGGLATGVYGQINGYNTQIFEMHHSPGGQCTAWQRKGYTFDACIHHLFGCKPGSSIYQLWKELGAMPREMVGITECTSIASPEGKMFIDYYDLEKLRGHLTDLSPTDSRVIEQYIKGIKLISKNDPLDIMFTGSRLGLLKLLPSMPFLMKWLKMTMKQFGEKFSDPFLRQAFPLLVYSMPDAPIFLHLGRHAYGMTNNIQWPIGGAQKFAKSIDKRYQELGGIVHYRSKVEKILVLNDKAAGVKLSDGSEHYADYVISNADGRKTIMNMLEGKYLNEMVKDYCKEPPDEIIMAVNVFLGVNRDLSKEPSAIIMLLDKPEIIANHNCESLEIQIYSFDKTMAPQGKSTIKIELVSGYDYWKQLYEDKAKYDEAKQRVAQQVIDILERRFPGIRNQIEVIDVTTLVTWERYMGGTHGWNNFPNRAFNFSFIPKPSGKRYETTLPGLSNFYFTGVWATMAGALYINALSGKKTIQTICKKDGIKFKTKQKSGSGWI
jgi:phytoene dehydrogenase-like protein